jgi:hypothetical protein
MSEPNDLAFNSKPASEVKVLPMLDHVMLWVARIFAFLVLLGTTAHAFWVKHDTAFDRSGIKVTLICACLIYVFCTFIPSYFICRLFLSISSLLLLVFISQGVFVEIRSLQELSVPLGQSLLFITSEFGARFVGLIAVLWIAYRPLQNSVHSV